jgi:hypothetical protein
LQWHRSVAHTIALFPSPFPSAAAGGTLKGMKRESFILAAYSVALRAS